MTRRRGWFVPSSTGIEEFDPRPAGHFTLPPGLSRAHIAQSNTAAAVDSTAVASVTTKKHQQAHLLCLLPRNLELRVFAPLRRVGPQTTLFVDDATAIRQRYRRSGRAAVGVVLELHKGCHQVQA